MAMPTEAELRELLRPSAVEDALTCLWISAGLIGLIAGLKLLGVFGPLRPAPVIGEALGGLVMLT